MKTTIGNSKSPAISDAAVHAKTGRNWSAWFKILDAAGAKKMTHQEIVGILSKKYNIGAWWQQMVAVTYEQARGLRKRYQRPVGFSVNVSATLAVPRSVLYKAWADPGIRASWLPDPSFTIRKAAAPKSMRITWVDEKTNVEANFSAKGKSKSQVAVEHAKLPSSAAVERTRKYWKKALAKLKAMLEA